MPPMTRTRYAPKQAQGRVLLAHELVHTIQQGDAGSPSSSEPITIDRPDSAAEREAAAIGVRVAAPATRGVGRMLARMAAGAVHGTLAGLDPDAPEPDEVDEDTDPLAGLAHPPRPVTTSPDAKSARPRPLPMVTLPTRIARQSAPARAPAHPAPVSITTTAQSGPTWSPHGGFHWRIGLRTTGRSGWIVQEIINKINVTDSAGSTVNTSAVVPRYWEAWAVDGSGTVTPAVGSWHDQWIRPSWGANTKGKWSMTGKKHFTKTDPATQGFTPGGGSNAGGLLSTPDGATTAPSGLGPVLRWRSAHGTWDDNKTPPSPHSGTAT